jgi:hypothetical protein
MNLATDKTVAKHQLLFCLRLPKNIDLAFTVFEELFTAFTALYIGFCGFLTGFHGFHKLSRLQQHFKGLSMLFTTF